MTLSAYFFISSRPRFACAILLPISYMNGFVTTATVNAPMLLAMSGTGAAPVIAEIANSIGALTVAVVTKPFIYEMGKRIAHAKRGLDEMKKYADSVIVIPNEKVRSLVDKSTPILKAFELADDVLRQAFQGISDIIIKPGYINVDFADIKTIMSHMGRAVMGMGTSSGENRAADALKKAIASPLLEDSSIEGAKGILINISGGMDLALHEISEASLIIEKAADKDANVILGCVIDETLGDKVVVTVIATGFNDDLQVPVAVGAGIGNEFKKTSSSQNDMDRPAFTRKFSTADFRNEAVGIENDEWDMPAFLRRKG